jgi:hypothetical protein
VKIPCADDQFVSVFAEAVRAWLLRAAIAFSSEVDTGSREENASKQEFRALVLIQSEPKL